MFLVVEDKGEIIAYCGLLMVLDEGDITNVAVKSTRQKEGIGQFLMDSLIRLAGEQGLPPSILRSAREILGLSVFMNEWDLQKTGSVKDITLIPWRMRFL